MVNMHLPITVILQNTFCLLLGTSTCLFSSGALLPTTATTFHARHVATAAASTTDAIVTDIITITTPLPLCLALTISSTLQYLRPSRGPHYCYTHCCSKHYLGLSKYS